MALADTKNLKLKTYAVDAAIIIIIVVFPGSLRLWLAVSHFLLEMLGTMAVIFACLMPVIIYAL